LPLAFLTLDRVHFDLPSQPQGLEDLFDGSFLTVAVAHDLTLGEFERTLSDEVEDVVSRSARTSTPARSPLNRPGDFTTRVMTL
jgi:hypothetical protein